MSYSTYETSTELGNPIELYQFNQEGTAWRFTSSDHPITIGVISYTPEAIVRSEISQDTDITRTSITVSMSRDNSFASQFIGRSPDLVTTLTIFRVHDSDSTKEQRVMWKGRVIRASVTDNEVKLECESVFSSLRRAGLRAKFHLSCRHALYSAGCGVERSRYKVQGNVQLVSVSYITSNEAATYSDGYFTGGIVRLTGGETRFITKHVGSSLYLMRPFASLKVGEYIELFPGCNHHTDTCKNKFSNLDNFGGFPYIPNVNPFGGSSIAL